MIKSKFPICPDHGPLHRAKGVYGVYWICLYINESGVSCQNMANKSRWDGYYYITNQQDRDARQKAHEVFDKLWLSGIIGRDQAYEWLRGVMRMGKNRCHIQHFGIEECAKVVKEVNGLVNYCKICGYTEPLSFERKSHCGVWMIPKNGEEVSRDYRRIESGGEGVRERVKEGLSGARREEQKILRDSGSER